MRKFPFWRNMLLHPTGYMLFFDWVSISGIEGTTMLKVTHEILLHWKTQTKLNDCDYENTTPTCPHPKVYFTKNTVVRENATDSSICLVSDVSCTQSRFFLFHYLTMNQGTTVQVHATLKVSSKTQFQKPFSPLAAYILLWGKF